MIVCFRCFLFFYIVQSTILQKLRGKVTNKLAKLSKIYLCYKT
jgi:hypothetical protein